MICDPEKIWDILGPSCLIDYMISKTFPTHAAAGHGLDQAETWIDETGEKKRSNAGRNWLLLCKGAYDTIIVLEYMYKIS